jgi:mannose-6-phosphate isomerase-like protein (cupin superfamily)
MPEHPVITEVVEGDGWAAGHLDALGEGWGFRKVRVPLGVTSMGANALVLPPRYQAGFHYHDEQEELYFIHAGDVELEFGDGSVARLAPGAVARVDANTVRRLRNLSEEDAVIFVVGGKGGYVGRDAHLAGDEGRAGGPIDG